MPRSPEHHPVHAEGLPEPVGPYAPGMVFERT
jgi:hypothetical protein